MEFQVFDDGGSITEYTWTVMWREDSVEVILHGCEQEDETYELTLDGSLWEDFIGKKSLTVF